MKSKAKFLGLVFILLSMLLTSCRSSCGARKARKSNKYYGTITNTNANKTLLS